MGRVERHADEPRLGERRHPVHGVVDRVGVGPRELSVVQANIGQARPSIGWGGRVVGRWEQQGAGVVWQLHADVGADGRADIAGEVSRLGRFLEASGL